MRLTDHLAAIQGGTLDAATLEVRQTAASIACMRYGERKPSAYTVRHWDGIPWHVWIVGAYPPAGDWQRDSTWETEAAAEQRARYLNEEREEQA